MLIELSITICLIDALEKMSGYARFIKDLATKKHTVSFEPANNENHCYVVATRSLVVK